MVFMTIRENTFTKIYIISVLLVTWLVTIILFMNSKTALGLFSLIMFIPGSLALVFNWIEYKNKRKLYECFTKKVNLKSMMFAIFYPILFLVFCALIAQITGMARLNLNNEKMSLIKSIIIIAITLIINVMTGTLGEEYGWRGYLLPRLTESVGKTKATIIVGIVWAMFHVPAVFLLAKITGIGNPFLLCLIQAFVVFVTSFSFSYCYYLSGNIIPVLFLHSIWNIANTRILGNIYTNKTGIMDGNLVLINGEGFLGLVVGTILIYWFVRKFKKSNIKQIL